MRILLVEDEPAMSLVFAAHLRRAGHDVDVAISHTKALELLAANRYDVAAIDLVLVQSTGDTVAEAACTRGLGVVLMSAAVEAGLLDDVSQTLLLKGFRVHAALKKPFTPEVLRLKLEEANRAKTTPPEETEVVP
jgi:DNA-binding response OmpR family regulator